MIAVYWLGFFVTIALTALVYRQWRPRRSVLPGILLGLPVSLVWPFAVWLVIGLGWWQAMRGPDRRPRTGRIVAACLAAQLTTLIAFGAAAGPVPTTAAQATQPAPQPARVAPKPAPRVAPLPPPPVVVVAKPDYDHAAVTRVIDGDTFEVADGRTIRVLGIDSCETDTPGGAEATAQAEDLLLGVEVNLVQEPGVTTDRSGRELRYVEVGFPVRDFGREMVRRLHTGIYEGENDASAEYLATLDDADINGRSCGASQPDEDDYVPPPSDDDDRDDYVSPPVSADDSSGSSGSSSSGGGGRVGRDGDGDGLCNESTVPVPC